MTRGRLSSNVVILATALVASACAPTTIRSGIPAGSPAPGYDGRWHSSFLFGTVEGSDPIDLATLCPSGWSEVRTDMSFVQGMLLVLSLFFYAPSRVTVVCADTGHGPKLPPGEGVLPPFEWLPARGRGPLSGGSRNVRSTAGNARLAPRGAPDAGQ